MIVRQRLRPKTAASYLGISESNLAKRRMRGDPPPFLKLGRSVAYEVTDLDAFLASSRYNSTSEYPSPAVSDRQGVVPPSEAGTADGLIDRAVPPTVLPTRRRSKIGPPAAVAPQGPIGAGPPTAGGAECESAGRRHRSLS